MDNKSISSVPRGLFVICCLMIAGVIGTGCGSSSVDLIPDYHNRTLATRDFRRDSVRFVNVVDKRANPGEQIGKAQVGLFNQVVPYNLKVPVAEFVRHVLDSLIAGPNVGERYMPITVVVDSFHVGERTSLFSEEGYFDCKMRFVFRAARDSIVQAGVISAQQSSGMDVTNSLEGLIYQGMVDCAKKFVEESFDKRRATMILASDSSAVAPGVHPPGEAREILSVDTFPPPPEYAQAPGPDSLSMSAISLHYLKGDKITTGIRGGYDVLRRKTDPKAYFGVGYTFTFFDVDNKQDFLTGTFFNFGARFQAQYRILEGRTSPYFAAGLGLAFGTEKISYGTREETSVFIGPAVEELIGISIQKKFSIEGGAFQLRYFGSKLLPSDAGFLVGITIGI